MDTSDNKNKISTLLLKQQDVLFDWERTIRELEVRLLKSSLVWPSQFLKKYSQVDLNAFLIHSPHPKANPYWTKTRSFIGLGEFMAI